MQNVCRWFSTLLIVIQIMCFVTLAQTVLLLERVLRPVLTMGSVPFRGPATMVPGTDMSFEEYAEKARRHLEDPSQPDPRLLLTPGCSAHMHNGVRGPATERGWRPAAKRPSDKYFPLEMHFYQSWKPM